jgi:tetratricopeptide (TPR) repeat protein
MTMTLESTATLPVALVVAFVEEGKRRHAVMPKDQGGNPRTKEVREALTRMMVDAKFYEAHRQHILALLAERGMALPLEGVPLPSYDDNDIATNGFAKLSPEELALLALDPVALESVAELVCWMIPEDEANGLTLGPWFEQAQRDNLNNNDRPPTLIAKPFNESIAVSAESRTVPSGPENDRRKAQAKAVKEEPGKNYRGLIATVVLIPLGFILGCGQISEAHKVSKQSNQHLDRASELNNSSADADRRQIQSEYETAQAVMETAKYNLVWRLFYGGDRQRLESLRNNYLVTKGLQKVVTESNRTWLTEDGIKATSMAFAEAFREVGLFPTLRNGQRTETMTNVDSDFCVDILTKQFSVNPAARQEVLSAIDHWISVLKISKQTEVWKPTIDLLNTIALEVDKDNSIRKQLADNDRKGLALHFGWKAAVGGVSHPRPVDEFSLIPAGLLVRVYDLFQTGGQEWATVADLHIRRSLLSHPSNPNINGIMLHRAVNSPLRVLPDGRDQFQPNGIPRQYAWGQIVVDPENPIFWNAYANSILDSIDSNADQTVKTAAYVEVETAYLQSIQAATRVNRPFALVHRNLGVAYQHMGQHEQAAREFEVAIKESKLPGQSTDDDPLYHYSLGQALNNAGRDLNRTEQELTAAIGLFEKYFPNLERRPREYGYSIIERGRARLANGDISNAVADFKSAEKLLPNYYLPFLNVGAAYSQAGDLEKAIDFTLKSVGFEPTTIGYYNLGKFHFSQGDLKQAESWFQRAIDLKIRECNQEYVKLAHIELQGCRQWIPFVGPADTYAKSGTGMSSLDLAAALGLRGYYTLSAKMFRDEWAKEAVPTGANPSQRFRLMAIGAAVRAGRKGSPNDKGEVREQKELNNLALEWARLDLQEIAKINEHSRRDDMLTMLLIYQSDYLLSMTREAELRKQLSETEQKEWEVFWNELNQLTRKVRARPLDK